MVVQRSSMQSQLSTSSWHRPSPPCLFLTGPSIGPYKRAHRQVITLDPRRPLFARHQLFAIPNLCSSSTSSTTTATITTSSSLSLPSPSSSPSPVSATATSGSFPAQIQLQARKSARPQSSWNAETHELQLFNTLTRDKQTFTTHEPGRVSFYSCGPTVYDYAHVGNFRAFLTYDVIKRWLIYRGYRVMHITNLTDVDDKIIRRAQEQQIEASEITEKFARIFFDDLNLLNVVPADKYPRATEHIDDMEEMINTLLQRGHAYQRDGSTYFRVSSFPTYGELAQLDKRQGGCCSSNDDDGQEGNDSASTDADEYDKDDVRDFALWKAYKEEDGNVFWNTSLGKGRPGWHIECSAMAMRFFGPKLDIHGGGIDLVFPHHDNEIAQSEAATGEKFSTFWVHNGFVNIDNEKMSKSLGNFRTLRDVVKRADDARAFRYLVVSSQYRSALAFTQESLKSARNTIKRLDSLCSKLRGIVDDHNGTDKNDVADGVQQAIENTHQQFCVAMDDDLNTPRAAAAMFSLVNYVEKAIKAQQVQPSDASAVLDCLNDMDGVFGIFYTPNLQNGEGSGNGKSGESDEDAVNASPELAQLLVERAEARKAKDFGRADEIRDKISAAGFAIIDTKEGAKLKKLEES